MVHGEQLWFNGGRATIVVIVGWLKVIRDEKWQVDQRFLVDSKSISLVCRRG